MCKPTKNEKCITEHIYTNKEYYKGANIFKLKMGVIVYIYKNREECVDKICNNREGYEAVILQK